MNSDVCLHIKYVHSQQICPLIGVGGGEVQPTVRYEMIDIINTKLSFIQYRENTIEVKKI